MKLKYKITLIVMFLGLLILVTVSTIYSSVTSAKNLQDTKNEYIQHTKNDATYIKDKLYERLAVAKTIGLAPILVNGLEKSNAYYESLSQNEQKTTIEKLNTKWKNERTKNSAFIDTYLNNEISEYLKEQQKAFPGVYGEIFVTNQYGAMIATTGVLSTLAHSYKYWWKQSYNGGNGKVFFDDRGYDESVEGYVLGVVVPIKKDGKTIGILKVNVNILATLNFIMKKHNALHKGALKVVRSKGLVVLEDGKTPLSTRVNDEVTKRLLRMDSGIFELKDNFVVYAPILLSDDKSIGFGGKKALLNDHKKGNENEIWHVVTEVDKQIINKENEQINRAMISIFILVLLASFLISLFIGVFISNPIAKLSKTVRKFGKGELDARAFIETNDEVGALAQSFNQMAENLEQTMISRNELLEEVKKRKLIEQELSNLNDRYELAIKGANNGVWDWNLTDNKIYYDPRCKSMLGYEDDEVKNEIEEWSIRLHPDDEEKTRFKVRENQEGKTESYEHVYRLKHKDGHWVWILSRAKTIFDRDKKAVRMIGINTDITKLKELEEKLVLEMKKSYELGIIVENAINEVYIFSADDLKFSYLNKSALKNIGYSFDELKDKTPIDIKPNLELDDFNKLVKPLLEEEKKYVSFFTVHERKDGTTYPVKVNLQLIKYMEEVSYVAIIMDRSEEETMNQNLRQKEELMIAQSRHAAMGEMISMIAHQWRQPLGVISMGANNIIADVQLESISEESLLEVSQEILFETDYLSKTIDDFRNFFRPDKETEKVDIESVFDEVFKIMGKSLESNDITIKKSFLTHKTIDTYSRELLQVFINIIKNAKEALVEHREKDRSIEIVSKKADKKVIITIKDNAGGIEEDILSKVFEPYFSTKDEKNGTGLGLYMSKTIIEKHLKGSIRALNHATGVIFEIVLPYRIDEEKND